MKAEYAKAIYALGEYYQLNLNAGQISMYAEDLLVLNPEELKEAILTYRRNPANVFFPKPGQLIAIIKPVETELDLGRLVAARIIQAVGKFGNYRYEDAKAFIGELGWEVVKMQGGWNKLCALTSEELRAEQPRMRDLAQSINKRAKLGTLEQAPALSAPSHLSIVSETMKKLGVEK